ncbi:MAG: hypothetical protein EBU74_02635 [Betaproteobacteria bacterium]|nr:hypothetical protein [Betaproteobacteria bacterium]
MRNFRVAEDIVKQPYAMMPDIANLPIGYVTRRLAGPARAALAPNSKVKPSHNRNAQLEP